MAKASTYKPLDLNYDSDVDSNNNVPSSFSHTQNVRKCFMILAVSLTLCFFSIISLVASITRTPSEIECAKRVSPWSPMWDAVEFWEGDLINYFNHSTIYRGPPTPEREKAWDDLWHYPSIPVSEAGIRALNKTQHGKHIEMEGSDPAKPTYGAIVEVFHQLHCLDMIRQYTWLHLYNESEPYFPLDFLHPVGGRVHVDHYFEALRLSLMCYSDITPVLIEYDTNRRIGRVADFSVHHKCRNFDRIVDWLQENGVGIPFVNVTREGGLQ